MAKETLESSVEVIHCYQLLCCHSFTFRINGQHLELTLQYLTNFLHLFMPFEMIYDGISLLEHCVTDGTLVYVGVSSHMVVVLVLILHYCFAYLVVKDKYVQCFTKLKHGYLILM